MAAIVAADLGARMLAANDPIRLLRQPTSWVDLFILVTLLFPETLANLGFLRILRLWSLSRSETFGGVSHATRFANGEMQAMPSLIS